MRALSLVACALCGCNALTGVNDLEEVPCTTDCVQVLDAEGVDTEAETTADTSSADAVEEADARDTARVCMPSDCDDMNACTKDACDAGTCAHDLIDGDGDGEAATSLGSCGLDCDDANKDVFAKQKDWFDKPFVDAMGAASYDYDCSGAAEKERPLKATCAGTSSSCKLVTAGWSASVPACGATGTWVTACVWSGFVCIPSGGAKTTQRCH